MINSLNFLFLAIFEKLGILKEFLLKSSYFFKIRSSFSEIDLSCFSKIHKFRKLQIFQNLHSSNNCKDPPNLNIPNDAEESTNSSRVLRRTENSN